METRLPDADEELRSAWKREPDLHFENAWAGAPKSCLGPALVTQQRSFLIGMSQGNDAIEKIARIKLPLVTHFDLFSAQFSA